MKFLIQKINKELRHDFTFALVESIRYHNWLTNSVEMKHKFIDSIDKNNPNIWHFKNFHHSYVPVGSVEFVLSFMTHFGIEKPKPMNVPNELIQHAGREVINGNEMTVEFLFANPKEYIIKSNDKIKGFSQCIDTKDTSITVPKGNYQISEVIHIESEWRCFVYKGKLLGIQYYTGDFTVFPDVSKIYQMIDAFKSAPVAYTLDVGVNYIGRSSVLKNTFVIECHDFFSCGLYGFSDYTKYPHMLQRWFNEYKLKSLLS